MAKPAVLPKTVDVLGKKFKVTVVESLDDGASVGEMSLTRQTVKIAAGQPFDNERDTVVHEFFHAVDDTLQLGLKEKQVHMMATGFYQVMRANPKLMKYLLDKEPAENLTSPKETNVPDL